LQTLTNTTVFTTHTQNNQLRNMQHEPNSKS